MIKPAILFRSMTDGDKEIFAKRVGYYPGPNFGGIAAFKEYGGEPMGAVGFDNWTKTAVTAHWYIRQPRCLLPLWGEVVSYLRQHGKIKMIGHTPSDNVRALRVMIDRLGWCPVARIRDGYDVGVDIIVSEYVIKRVEAAADGQKRRAESA